MEVAAAQDNVNEDLSEHSVEPTSERSYSFLAATISARATTNSTARVHFPAPSLSSQDEGLNRDREWDHNTYLPLVVTGVQSVSY
eukprot:2194877-Rhodomonas_salina.2